MFAFNRLRYVGVLLAFLGANKAMAVDLDWPPINYAKSTPNDVISKFQQKLDSGKASLSFDENLGYLPSLLRELQVPRSSQMFVFSKTSLQRRRITPKTPRAIYFNNEVYVGYCHRGEVLEISAVDPRLGTVFYTLDQMESSKPRFQRQTDACLICHGSSVNQGFPGHLVRSTYTDADGQPLLGAGSFKVDDTSPFKQRWGGWYVTGTHGNQMHLGNLILRTRTAPEEVDNRAGMNVTDLSTWFTTAAYLTPHSDIVALMVMEHQAEMHNRITHAGMQTRLALYDESELNKALGRPQAAHSELTTHRIKNACDPLVQCMLFSGETKLTDKVQGTSAFTQEFAEHGPRDSRKRSLRDFDLQRRLFAFPCSYLIYSEAFEGLPAAAKEQIYQRLWDVLNGKDKSADFAHLTAADRQAIREILVATKNNLPAYWKAP